MRAGKDGSGTFYSFQCLCNEINSESSYGGKTKIVSEFLSRFKGDFYLLIRLLLCKNDKRVYGLREKQLVKLMHRYTGAPLKDLLTHLEQGDVSETMSAFLLEHSPTDVPRRSTLTLKEVRWAAHASCLAGDGV